MFQSEIVDKTKPHVLCLVPFFEDRVEPDRPQTTILRVCLACCITQATNTHSEYLIFIAFPLQQRLQDRDFMLSCTYIACLVEC
jgi:hypothetical protein